MCWNSIFTARDDNEVFEKLGMFHYDKINVMFCDSMMVFEMMIYTNIWCFVGKERKISEYYKKQERLYEGYNEMETMNESGCFPGSLTEVGLVER